jgi:IS605 OrfB family transposase
LRKLRQLSKSLSRKKKGSRNQEKAKLRLAKMYLKIFNIRQDTLHKATTYLAKSHSKVVIEDLLVSGMMKNRKLARAIADVGFYEFRRQLEYECEQCGLVIDRDLNAALNLVAVSLPETQNACGEEIRLLADSLNLQRAALMKQEPNIIPDSMSKNV